MIESRTGPGGSRMARIASGREPGRFVIRIRGVVVVRLVAAHARGWQCRVVVVDVAHHAGHGRRRVEPGQRESRVVVIERRSRPVGGAMTGVACGRET